MDNIKLAAEVVKLKQEMAELRAGIEEIEKTLAGMINDAGGYYGGSVLKPLDDGYGHAEDGWPWDTSATDGITTGTRKPELFTPG